MAYQNRGDGIRYEERRRRRTRGTLRSRDEVDDIIYTIWRIKMTCKKPNVGGQAVIEGVMMRGADKVAVAVRKPDGEIEVDVKPVSSIRDKYPILKKPLLRGVIALFESLHDGMKALAYSAQVSGDEDEQLSDKEMAMTILTSVALAIGLFIVVPTWSMRFMHTLTDDPMLLNLAEGVLRMVIFLCYIAAISSMEDIQRVFQYHGAEHKTIYTQVNSLAGPLLRM